jgi:BRCA1-associated protein
VHVYRDCDRPPESDKLASSSSAREINLDDGVTLGVLAVPAWMTPSDFLAFVAPAAEGMAHLRLVRSVPLSWYRFVPMVTP